MTAAAYSGSAEEDSFLQIDNEAGITRARITTETIDNATVFSSLTGVVATGQGTEPVLTWTGAKTGTYNVILHSPPPAPDGAPPYTVKYKNGVEFINGYAIVDWNTMTAQTP